MVLERNHLGLSERFRTWREAIRTALSQTQASWREEGRGKVPKELKEFAVP